MKSSFFLFYSDYSSAFVSKLGVGGRKRKRKRKREERQEGRMEVGDNIGSESGERKGEKYGLGSSKTGVESKYKKKFLMKGVFFFFLSRRSGFLIRAKPFVVWLSRAPLPL